jgi:predicted peroxiredoxin
MNGDGPMANGKKDFEKLIRERMRPVEELIAQAKEQGYHVQVAAALGIDGKPTVTVAVLTR